MDPETSAINAKTVINRFLAAWGINAKLIRYIFFQRIKADKEKEWEEDRSSQDERLYKELKEGVFSHPDLTSKTSWDDFIEALEKNGRPPYPQERPTTVDTIIRGYINLMLQDLRETLQEKKSPRAELPSWTMFKKHIGKQLKTQPWNEVPIERLKETFEELQKPTAGNDLHHNGFLEDGLIAFATNCLVSTFGAIKANRVRDIRISKDKESPLETLIEAYWRYRGWTNLKVVPNKVMKLIASNPPVTINLQHLKYVLRKTLYRTRLRISTGRTELG